jgi:hypothetical protein
MNVAFLSIYKWLVNSKRCNLRVLFDIKSLKDTNIKWINSSHKIKSTSEIMKKWNENNKKKKIKRINYIIEYHNTKYHSSIVYDYYKY